MSIIIQNSYQESPSLEKPVSELCLKPEKCPSVPAQRVREVTGQCSLGSNTKYSSHSNPQKDVFLKDNHRLRAQKYGLQTSARSIILHHSGFDQTKTLDFDQYNKLPRVVKCSRHRCFEFVDLNMDAETEKAFYSNLTFCGSVWSCPVCASKIEETRRKEFQSLFSWAYGSGFKIIMVTLTNQHYKHDSAADLLEKQAKALKYLRSGVTYQKFKKRIGLKGFTRTLEILYGQNGWHPHYHEAYIVPKDVNPLEFEQFMRERWEYASEKVGLIPKGKKRAFREHAVHVVDNAKSSDYLAKNGDNKHFWGADRELALSSKKKSKGLVHPFQMLDLWNTDKKYGAIFYEYIQAMHGKRQHFWSKGLKKLVLDQEQSDEELANQEPEESTKICSFEFHSWNKILDLDARAEILTIAENFGRRGVDDWLSRFGLHAVDGFF